MVAYKGGACQLCGYRACLAALDFHHLDPASKNFHFGGNHSVGFDRIQGELNRCVLVCRNCHSEVEEAIRLSERGHRLTVLDRLHAAGQNWAAPTDLPPFTRSGWEPFHPAYWRPDFDPLLKITERSANSPL